jgi:hypothetical protein
VRTFVWAATWNPDIREVDVVFDEIGLENALADNPELLKPPARRGSAETQAAGEAEAVDTRP